MKRQVQPKALRLFFLLTMCCYALNLTAQFTQQGSKLVGTGSAATAWQGHSVALSGDGNTAIVGAPLDDSNQGAVWIYTRSGSTWTQQGSKLVGTGNVGAAQQGRSVALSNDGNTALVGGYADNSSQGAVWVFTRSGTTWTQQAKLVGTGNTGAAQQGQSVSLSSDGNTALVGGWTDNSSQGAAWVFTRSGTTWTQEGSKLVGTGNSGAAQRGTSVALSGDGNTALMGGAQDGSFKGATWVFTRSGTTWTQQGAKLVGSSTSSSGYQGTSVALSDDGNTALVGGPRDNGFQGATWVFTRSGTTWTEQSKLVGTGNTGSAAQGQSVTLSSDGNTALVGGYFDNSNQGAVWVFTRSGTTWTQQGSKLVGTGSSGAANQGQSIALSDDGNTVLVGGISDDSDQGAAWVFFNTPCTTPTAFNMTGGGAYCAGGTGVAVGLDNSETGVTYQLKKDNVDDGTAVDGTGSAILFGTKTAAGTYAVVATRTADACTNNMTGSVTIMPTVTPSVSIAANPTGSITSGTSVTFTATPTNGGTTPAYQWQKNGNDVGTNSATYTDAALANGDKIKVTMTSNDACASPATATSNEMTMAVTVANGPVCSSFSTKTGSDGLGNGYVNNLFVVGNTVYAATMNGLSISTNGGTSFSNKTTANGLGTNTTYAVYASGSNVYVATQGGLSISTNGGTSFSNKTTANGLGNNNVADVYVAGNTVYAATGNGLGISTDGGASFSNKTTANGLGNNLVMTVYVANDIIYAGTFDGLGISTNGGTSFSKKTTANGLGDNFISDLYADGNTIYAATVGGLSISTNGGASFVNKTTAQGLGDNFVIGVFAMGNTIYAATIGGLSISTNGGTSFTNYTTANGLGTNDMRAAFATANTVYVGTNGGGLSFCTASDCTPVTPTVSITSNDTDNSITAGTSVTFTATPTNGGSTPSYQWKKNGNDVGANSATYTDGALANSDKIKVIMTSNDACASPATATSNEITMTVTPACATPTAYNLTGGGAYCAGGTGVAIGLASSQTGVNYQLQKGNANIGNPVAGTGNALSFGSHTDAGTYTVVATSATGSCTANMNGNATVTSIPLPTAYNVTGGGSYCAGGAGVPVGLANSESGVSYQLKKDNNSVGNPVVGTGAAISFGNQTAPGTYTVEAIKNLPSPVRIGVSTGALAPPPSGGSCTVTMTGSVSVTSVTPPSANAGADKTTCGTAAVALEAVGTGKWSGGMGTFSDINSPTATYTPAAGEVNPIANNTVTLTWTVTGTTPCANATDQMTVTVRPPASANAGTDKTTCGTTAVALTPMGTILGGTAAWSGGAGTFSDATNPFATYTPAPGEVGTTVTLTLSIVGGPFCSNATDQMTVTVVSPATANAGPDKTTCGTAAVALEALGTGKWSGGMGTFSDVNSPTATYTPAAGEVNPGVNNTVTLTWTVTGTPPCPNSTDQMLLTIKPTPISALTASQVDVCPNTEVTLNAQCSIPTATINWNPGAPTVTPAAATLPYIYKASCTADGCTGNESSIEVRTHRILVDMKDLDVGTLPLPIVRAVKDNMTPTNLISAPVFPRRWTFIAKGCEASESAVFKLSGPVNFNTIDNAATYAMFANDAGGFYSLDHPNYGNGGSFPNGTYTLTVDLRSQDGVGGPFPKNRVATGSLLASRTLQFTITGPPSIVGSRQGVVSRESLTVEGVGFAEIAPNPVAHTLRLKVMDAKAKSINVNLIDASGRNLLQRTFVPQTQQHQEEFEVSHLNNGMYFLKVSAGDKQSTLKVIKVE